MGGDNMQVRRVASGINDSYRGVFLNRGVFVKAPPSFFAAYPSDFEQPPMGWEKLNVTLRTIQSWDRKTGLLAPTPPTPKLEVPPPEPTVVPQPAAVVAAASEPVAASDNAQPPTPDDAPVAKPKVARGRSVKIR